MILPMLCHTAQRLEDVPPHWVMEPKFDGWRWQAVITEDGVRTFGGRNGKEHDRETGQIDRALMTMPVDTILDGELIVVGGGTSSDVGRIDQREQCVLIVFDVLRFAGQDVCHWPWHERRELLEHELPDGVEITPIAEIDQMTLDAWLEAGMEGVIVKNPASTYRPGKRTREWLKLKPKQTTDAFVTGWVYGKGKGNGHKCGALEVTLVETGKTTTVGYGESPEDADALVGRRIELQHFGWTKHGRVRHPGFLRTREDLES